VMDRVAGYLAEDGPHAADDARLLAMENAVVPHEMVPDVFLRPAVLQRAVDCRGIALGGLGLVVPGVAVLAERDSYAGRMADLVILNDPPFAPVGADQPDLLGGRGRPRRGRVSQGEAAHGDIVDAGLFRVKDRLADIDLHQLLVWVGA